MDKLNINRPMPPDFIFSENEFGIILQPADIWDWIKREILSESGNLYNPDHAHLADADIGFLWASDGFRKQGKYILGQTEQFMVRAGGWQKARAEQQMVDWFGRVPEFIITLSASFCAECQDIDFCALIDHELYHIAQDLDAYDEPKFTKEGLPKLSMRAHDVEEFVGVVRRYGPSEDVKRLVDAANKKPEFSGINIARACGTCVLKLA